MELSERIKSFSRQIHPEVIKFRRHLHANPELSFEEYNTAKFVAGKLREFGLTPSSRSLRREVAKLYIPLLRQHIFKENNVQFRMAEQVMSEADDAEVTDKFSQVEQQRGLTGWHDSYSSDVVHWEQTIGEEE